MKTSNKVKNIKGNLLDFPAGINIACHCANAFCVMGAGIAAEIASRYPKAYEADKKTRKGDEEKMGSYSYAKVGVGKYIVNIYGQYGFGKEKRQVNYEYLTQGMEEVYQLAARDIKANPKKQIKIGFPRLMGCGLAGGDWSIVEAIIFSLAEKYEVETFIVDFN